MTNQNNKSNLGEKIILALGALFAAWAIVARLLDLEVFLLIFLAPIVLITFMIMSVGYFSSKNKTALKSLTYIATLLTSGYYTFLLAVLFFGDFN